MDKTELKPNIIVNGPFFPEPVQVIVVVPMGAAVKMIGKGSRSGQVYEPVLNSLKSVDLGLVHSSAAELPISNVLNRLSTDGDVEKGISPFFLVKHWSPAFKEWSTKAVRDAFYASPVFPRILNPEAVKDTIAKGVESGQFGFVGKSPDGKYDPFLFGQYLDPSDIEISDEFFVIKREVAEEYKKQAAAGGGSGEPAGRTQPDPGIPGGRPGEPPSTSGPGSFAPSGGGAVGVAKIAWSGELAPQKWMNFYTRVLSKFATGNGLKLTIKIEVAPDGGVSQQKLDETRIALRELGLNDKLDEA